MRAIQIRLKIYALLGVILILSCSKIDQFDIPIQEEVIAIPEGTHITINSLYNLWLQELTNNENDILTIDSETYITGYVISNDEAGNFFEELIIQNEVSNPNRGIKLLLDANPLFTRYEFGRKIHVQLKNLSVGLHSGVLSLGVRNGNSVDKIAESKLPEFVKRDTIRAEIVPMPIHVSEFSFDRTNLYVLMNDVQFSRKEVLGELPITYAGEEFDEFDGERILESCDSRLTTILSTSIFADFKAEEMPEGKGYIEGILTYNFFGEAFNIVVNEVSDIHMDDPDRCDPEEIDCGLAPEVGNNELFNDFFEDQTPGSPINDNGWTNFIEEGTAYWEAYSDDGTNASLGISARIGSYNSGDTSSIAWLITPEINFNDQIKESLNFKTSNSFSDGSVLEVLISTDWNGNSNSIASSIWDLLSSAAIVDDDQSFADWVDSGDVSLDCINGSAYIAFRYVGNGYVDFDGTYELDEIEVRSK